MNGKKMFKAQIDSWTPVGKTAYLPHLNSDAGADEALAGAFVAAYGPGHPDQRDPDLQLAARSLRNTAEDPDNPLMEETSQVAVVGGVPVGAAIVTMTLSLAGIRRRIRGDVRRPASQVTA